MNRRKDKPVKLGRDERRVGNFIVKEEREHIKFRDLNGIISFRVSRRTAVGMWLEHTLKLKEEGEGSLKTYITLIWTSLAVVPDQEFAGALLNISKDAMSRHPEWYGYKPSEDEKENDDAAREVKEMKEFEDDVMNFAEKEEK